MYNLMASSSGFSDHTGQFINFAFGPTKGTESAFGQLSCFLVLRVSDQFHDPTFVRGKSSNLTDDGANKRGALGGSSLEVRRLVGKDPRSGFVARVESSGETCAGRCHSGGLCSCHCE